MNHLLGQVSRGKWNLCKIKRTKGKRESDKAHIVKKNRSSTWLCCVRHFDRYWPPHSAVLLSQTTQSAVCQKCQPDTLRTPLYEPCLPLSLLIFLLTVLFLGIIKGSGQEHGYWNHKCVDEVYCGNQSVAMCGNRMSLCVFNCASYLAERLRLSHQNQ